MNRKRTFGSILNVLCIVGSIVGPLVFLGVGGVGLSKINSVVPFVEGLTFFFVGIKLVKTIGDQT